MKKIIKIILVIFFIATIVFIWNSQRTNLNFKTEILGSAFIEEKGSSETTNVISSLKFLGVKDVLESKDGYRVEKINNNDIKVGDVVAIEYEKTIGSGEPISSHWVKFFDRSALVLAIPGDKIKIERFPEQIDPFIGSGYETCNWVISRNDEIVVKYKSCEPFTCDVNIHHNMGKEYTLEEEDFLLIAINYLPDIKKGSILDVSGVYCSKEYNELDVMSFFLSNDQPYLLSSLGEKYIRGYGRVWGKIVSVSIH